MISDRLRVAGVMRQYSASLSFRTGVYKSLKTELLTCYLDNHK